MDDLRLIKKYYGEAMSHLCRSLFPTILETEGLLFFLMETYFAHSKQLYDDIIEDKKVNDFQRFISSSRNCPQNAFIINKNTKELMDEAGYILYECKNEDEIQKFKKYYAHGEELCTFNGGRLNSNYVFFAVKKDENSFKRSEFTNPERQDKYGTSVISIQFSRIDNFLSIKNRYNHKVLNPDATFSNNLDNIIPGLTHAFEKDYNLKIKYNKYGFELNNYKIASNGKFYKIYMEINNICYGPNNTIIDNGKIIEKYKDKSKYIVIDYFIIDIPNKKIFTYDKNISDSFTTIYDNFEKIEIVRESNVKKIYITYNNKKIELTICNNEIIKFTDNVIKEIDNNFFIKNKALKNIELNNVVKIGENFLYENKNMDSLVLPNVLEIGDSFLNSNELLLRFIAPKIVKIGKNFMHYNKNLISIDIQNIQFIDNDFLPNNLCLKCFVAKSLQSVGIHFLYNNENLENIDMPNLKYAGDFCLENIKKIKSVSFENLITIGYGFMKYAENLENIDLPNVENIGANFLKHNRRVIFINLPKVIKIGDGFLANNKILLVALLPNVLEIGDNFFNRNENLKIFSAPKLEILGEDCLEYNNNIEYLSLDSLIKCGDNFLRINACLIEYYAPKQEQVRYGSFNNTKNISRITLSPDCQIYYQCFSKYDNDFDELIDSIRKYGHFKKHVLKKIYRY